MNHTAQLKASSGDTKAVPLARFTRQKTLAKVSPKNSKAREIIHPDSGALCFHMLSALDLCMCLNTSAYTYLYIYVCVWLCMYIYIYVCVYLYVYIYICVYICMHACMHVCMHVYYILFIYLCIYVCMYLSMYVCISMYKYLYIYIWIWSRPATPPPPCHGHGPVCMLYVRCM